MAESSRLYLKRAINLRNKLNKIQSIDHASYHLIVNKGHFQALFFHAACHRGNLGMGI